MEIAELRGDGPRPAPLGYDGPVTWIGLTVDRAEHERRIAARARAQFDDGLIEEAVALRERYDPDLPAFSAIGYHEAWDVADGRSTLEEAVAADAQRNVAFAKRQRTWFRSEPDIAWLDTTSTDPFERALALARTRDWADRQPSASSVSSTTSSIALDALDDLGDRVAVVDVVDDPADDGRRPPVSMTSRSA